jgi:hypothetical protein
MEKWLAPPLKDNGLYIRKIRNEHPEIAQRHIGMLPLRKTLPDAHFARERASRRDLDLPGQKTLSAKRREQFL